MNNRIRISILVPLVLTVLSACAQATPAPEAGCEQEPSTILVVGQGAVERTPDAFTIEMAVYTCGPVIETAFDENNARMQAVLDYLREAGIADDDVATSEFAMTKEGPDYYSYCFADTPYRVSNSIHLTLRDTGRIGEILSGAIQHGINVIRNMDFFLQDPSEAILEARRKAIADAQEKARTLAEGLGRKLGDPIKTVEGDLSPSLIREVNVSYGENYFYGRGGGGDGSSIPIAIGNVDISVTLNITYQLL